MSTDFNPTGIDWNAGGMTGMVRFGEDRNLLVMFYNRPTQQAAESVIAGRPIYKDVIHIKIEQPGEMLNKIDRPVNENDKRRFPQQWSNFVHDRTQVPEGSPIDLLFPNHPAVAENLRAFGVYTIEQCEALSANAIDTIGRGAQEYKNRATKYLEMANKGTNFHLLQKELDDEKQKNRVMGQQLLEMKSQLDSLTLTLTDPIRSSLNPPFVAKHDVQADRINLNAPSREIAEQHSRRKSRRAPTVEEKITDPFAGQVEETS